MARVLLISAALISIFVALPARAYDYKYPAINTDATRFYFSGTRYSDEDNNRLDSNRDICNGIDINNQRQNLSWSDEPKSLYNRQSEFDGCMWAMHEGIQQARNHEAIVNEVNSDIKKGVREYQYQMRNQ